MTAAAENHVGGRGWCGGHALNAFISGIIAISRNLHMRKGRARFNLVTSPPSPPPDRSIQLGL